MATAPFVTYLQKPRESPLLELRAPPPSPVNGVHTSSRSGSPTGYGECPAGNEDDDVCRFLRCSARVPVLRLPERVVPRKKKSVWAPPVIDMSLLTSPENGKPVVETLRSAAVAFGCFQVVGHGITDGRYLASAALRDAAGKVRSPSWGGAEASRGGNEDGEELWWPLCEGDQDMAENWLLQNDANEFRNMADDLFIQLEQMTTKILESLQRGSVSASESLGGLDSSGSSRLCIRRCRRKQRGGGSASVSHDDIQRMLTQRSRRSRAIALHLCPGASAFHVFSRRGWSRFHPLHGAVVVTVGDQLQAWSSGIYKSVAGKLAYINDDRQGGSDDDDVVSAEFLHSRSPASTSGKHLNKDVTKIIPFNLQITVAACLVLVYHFLMSSLYAIW